MLDAESNSLKLVEFNTISAALSSLSQLVWEAQSYILDKYRDQLTLNYTLERDRKEDGFGSTSGKEKALSFALVVKSYIAYMKERLSQRYEEIK